MPLRVQLVSPCTFQQYAATLQPAQKLSLFDMDTTRTLTVALEDTSCSGSLSIRELCGDIPAILAREEDIEAVRPSFVCSDGLGRQVVVRAQVQWENRALELSFFVPLKEDRSLLEPV